MLVYRSDFAGTAQNTAFGLMTDDLDRDMTQLRTHGVMFHDYDMPGLKTVDGVAELGDERSAWFSDSEGNIIAIGQVLAADDGDGDEDALLRGGNGLIRRRHHSPSLTSGLARRYCSGHIDVSAPSSCAARSAKCGSRIIALPNITASTSPAATSRSACSGIVMRPTAETRTSARSPTYSARCAW